MTSARASLRLAWIYALCAVLGHCTPRTGGHVRLEVKDSGSLSPVQGSEATAARQASAGVEVSDIASLEDMDRSSDSGDVDEMVLAMQGPLPVSRDNQTCNSMYARARRILTFANTQLQDTLTNPGKSSILAAMQVFATDMQGRLAYQQISGALALLPLWSALQSGMVWTVNDQYNFQSLCLGEVSAGNYLEEFYTIVPTPYLPTPVVQGDIASVNELNAYLQLPNTASKLWTKTQTGRLEIGFCYSAEVQADQPAIVAFELAVLAYQAQLPLLEFVNLGLGTNVTNCATLPSILVTNTYRGCWSHFGLVSGVTTNNWNSKSQLLNLGAGCKTQGMAMHQLGHTLGLGHQLARDDRDSFVNFTVNISIISRYFQASKPLTKGPSDGAFDFLSIMMSSAYAFPSTTGLPTVIPTGEYELYSFMGQRMALSYGDVVQLAALYSLSAPSPLTPNKLVSQLFNTGGGISFNGSCINQHSGCSSLQHMCYDQQLGPQIQAGCQRTCLTCIEASAETRQHYLLRLGQDANATKDNAMDQALSCFDLLDTGIMFLSGEAAVCSELHNYCDHPTMGLKVRTSCVKTCGLCNLRSNITTNSFVSNCFDFNASTAPVFLMNNSQMECPQLWSYCTGNADSDFVRQKCGFTCGVCSGVIIQLKTETGTVTDTQTAANISKTVETLTESLTTGTGACDRRRRWGFCYSRRRRFDAEEVADP